MKEKKKRILDLFLFDGEGGGESSAGEGVANPNADGKEQVVYGKPTEEVTEPNNPSPESQPGEETKEVDRETKFKELIKGEFKGEYQKLLQDQLGRRLKNQKPVVDPGQQALFEHLKFAYGTEDPKQLLSILESDNRLFQEKADKLGMTVEDYRRKVNLDIREAQLNESEAQRQEDEEAAAIYQQFLAEGEALKEKFPNFDLETESENQDFTDLLSAGVPVAQAYQLVHMDEIMQGTAQMVANTVSKNTIENVRARGVRPAENGIVEQPGTVRKSNANELTDKDLDDIKARVSRGEKITF